MQHLLFSAIHLTGQSHLHSAANPTSLKRGSPSYIERVVVRHSSLTLCYWENIER